MTNIVNSATSGGASAPVTFTSNINGNVNGDIVLYPMIMAALLQAASTPSTNTSGTSNSTTATNQTNVTNSANLSATSGNAAVTNNTNAGSATSGSATAIGNIINIVNSAIAAGASFIGTININGNLNGDILVSPNFIPTLLTSNANTTTNATLSNTSNIVNNVQLGATSGTATVANNTNAGNATTGTAKTNLVLLNLTGHQVVAQNSLLVFVNVMGTWVGMIVDTTPGTTSAALGNGVTTNTAATTNVNAANTTNITNNLTLNAASGNASVTGNTTAGNATSGNAMAGANILNISQSSIGLSGWFGILFINVFGSWLGSFGVDTSSGNPPQASTSSSAPATPSGRGGTVLQPKQAIQFVAHEASGATHQLLGTSTTGAGSNSTSNGTGTGVAATTNTNGTTPPASLLPALSYPVRATTSTPALRMPSNLLSASMMTSTIFLAAIALRRLYADATAVTRILASS